MKWQLLLVAKSSAAHDMITLFHENSVDMVNSTKYLHRQTRRSGLYYWPRGVDVT